ncbi:TadE family protein [Nocardioides dongkuii]|uniref:TadE family protein n=1 Tax=Nocardioides dongkuii TaxID=2760089 RepID=UPI001878CAFE|nr:TadE family protein [Nocardioides dongkuii]
MSDLRRRCRRRTKGDRGAAALELVLIAPVVLAMFMLLAQWAIREQGERAVSAAAREGAVASAAWQAAPDAGRRAVADTLGSSGTDLANVEVESARSSTDASVTVRAVVPSLIPGVDLAVTSTQTAPLEVFVP